MLTFGSLFAGIGGFDLGFDRARMRCVWQVERDCQCLDLLAQKWPSVRRVNDVVRARYVMESKYAGRMDTKPLVRPDIICGGFPCQDLSVAGKRRGLAGGRSGLFWTMRRIIGILKPTWVVLENVPGLLWSNAGRDMGAVVGSLVDSGYGVAWRVLDSQFFGLAQRRKRVFIVGHLGDVRRAGAVLFDGESMSRNSPPSREARQGVAGTIESRTNGGGFPGSDGAMSGHVVAVTLRSRQSKPGVSMPGRGGEDDQNLVVAMTLNAKNGKRHDAESETFVTHALTGNGFDASEDGTGRGVPLAVQALTSNTGGLHIKANYVPQRQGVRRLMPIECERLQGFPDNWTAGFSDSARYRMLGNAVSVPVIEWIGRRIVEASTDEKAIPRIRAANDGVHRQGV